MATRIELLFVIGLLGCGREMEILLDTTSTSSDHRFVCADGTTVEINSSEESDIASACLGTACSGTLTPDSPICADPSMNKAAGTCVETFFSCFQPSGACMGTGSGTVWDNGAQDKQSEDFGDFGLYPAGASEPCIQRTQGDGSEVYWLKFAD